MLLNNIRVIDLSQYIPGPYVTRMLADLGADVIKLEPPKGDPMRYFSRDKNTLAPAYKWLNRGKRVVQIDLKSAQGVLKLNELLVSADILIDGFRPGVLSRLGFDQQALAKISPKLIHCALTGFGQTGPYSQKAGHDLGYCAVAGALSTIREDKQPPIFYPPLADHVGALQASNSILAALYSREITGDGTFIDASLYEAVQNWHYLIESQHISQVLGGDAAYYNVYQTLDRKFITLSALEEKFWRNFCLAVYKKDWIDKHSESLPQQQLMNEVSQLFESQIQQYWNELLQSVDCCYEPIEDIGVIAVHPQTGSRNTVDHYPNIINNQRSASGQEIIEITDMESLSWD